MTDYRSYMSYKSVLFFQKICPSLCKTVLQCSNGLLTLYFCVSNFPQARSQYFRDGTAEQFAFQYGLEGTTFKNENGECSKSHLSIIKVEQLDPILPEQNNSSCGSGSPGDPGPPGSSGFGSSMSPAAQFFRKCHQAGCTQFIFSEFASRLNTITERISSQQASEEDFNLTLKVLEASGMLPEIFAKRDQEMEKRLKDLQRETEAVRTARSAMRDACVMSFTPS
ncbi:uncharacterized protein LOC110501297 isoform X4 [Oncorhynchus mykiss]|uniref:uncharacterized protein LOC110501297 isoform X4 n=1 Tax=Oncorhynchus mykiss TaxID=8022 RepID=UPI000B4FA29F|nr:uncharacterized protein LOC110501297 isoform X4 [Oncorhynchus mykiss]